MNMVAIRQPLHGKVESMRDQDDDLYFRPVSFQQLDFMTRMSLLALQMLTP